MPDPFEQFAEQQASHEMLAEHGPLLARDAAEIAADNPSAQLVGIIVESGAPEAAGLLRVLSQHGMPPAEGFIGVVPRWMVLDLLRANAAHTLDFLAPASEGSELRKRVLPLVAVTKGGFRFGAIEYEVDL
jgi:hypothetical protein